MLTEDEIVRVFDLSADPELVELADIASDLEAMADRVEEMIERHNHADDSCATCRAIRDRHQGGRLDVWAALVGVRFALLAAAQEIESQRPWVVGDASKHSAIIASLTVEPDAVVGGGR